MRVRESRGVAPPVESPVLNTIRILAFVVPAISMLMWDIPFNPSMPIASLDPSWAMGAWPLAKTAG